MNIIEKNKSEIISLCQKHHVEELYTFGSVVSDSFNEKSDVDFLVRFGAVDPYEYFDNFMDFKESLENLLERSVDLLEVQTLKNPVLKRSIDRNKAKIYGRADSEMAF